MTGLYDGLEHVSAPVSNAPGKMQTGLFQMGLEARLPGDAATLRTDVRRSVFVNPLVGGHGTGVRQHHGRRALRTCLGQKGKKNRKIKQKSDPTSCCVTAGNKETQTHRVGRTSDLLEVGDQLSFAGELRLALWTFEVVVLQPLGFLARQGHQRLGALRCTSDRSRLSR